LSEFRINEGEKIGNEREKIGVKVVVRGLREWGGSTGGVAAQGKQGGSSGSKWINLGRK